MMVLWNGQLMDEAEVRISPFDPMLTQGMGVFETIRVVDREIRYWLGHYHRLSNSQDGLVSEMPEAGALEEQIYDVLRANELVDARVRVTLGTNLLITAVPLEEDIPTITIALAPQWPVNEQSPLAGVKCCSYAENRRILWQFGTGEVLRPNTRGELCEGCLSNVFFRKDEKIFTPSLESGCLPGVMRTQVMNRVSVEEGCWPLEILLEADEIWLSNAIRRLRCVSVIDGRDQREPSELFWHLRETLA